MSAPSTSRRSRRSAERRSGELVPRVSAEAALLPLRLFLGVTFVYAGIQKLSDPGYLHPGAPTYIGTQLRGFANGTPGGFLLRTFAIPAAKPVGVTVALVEIAVGLLVVAGLATRAAAAVGLVLNFVLFLTNSWKAYPYFLGSDIVFVFAWLPLVLAGASGQPALDSALDAVAARRLRRHARRGGPLPDPGLTRRALLNQAFGVTAAATFVLGGLSWLFKGTYRPTSKKLSGGRPIQARPTSAGGSGRAAPGSGVPTNSVRLGASSQLPSGQ